MSGDRRVQNWRKFSQHMEDYIATWTVEKYSADPLGRFDLMSITKDPQV